MDLSCCLLKQYCKQKAGWMKVEISLLSKVQRFDLILKNTIS